MFKKIVFINWKKSNLNFQSSFFHTAANIVTQCQIAANYTQNKTSKFILSTTKLYVVSTRRSFPNVLYARQRNYETNFNFLSSFCPSPQIKLFFVDRLIELRNQIICLTLKLQPHYTYISKNAFKKAVKMLLVVQSLSQLWPF